MNSRNVKALHHCSAYTGNLSRVELDTVVWGVTYMSWFIVLYTYLRNSSRVKMTM